MSEVKPPYEKALEMLYEKNAEIEALRSRLEEAERELKHCLNLDNHNNIVRQKNEEIKSLEAENTALKEKLKMVREWKKDYFGSLLGDAEDLNKILHGGESD